MSAFIHTGTPNLAMPYITCNDAGSTMGILDSIVNDLGGTNGVLPNSGQVPGPLTGQWQIYDDMRLFGQSKVTVTGTVNVQGSGSIAVSKKNVICRGGSHPPTVAQAIYNWGIVTNKVSGNGAALAGDMLGWDASINSVITRTADLLSQIVKVTSAPDAPTGSGAVTTSPAASGGYSTQNLYRISRAIVLKCNSVTQPFYVFIQEGGNAAIGLIVTVYETWNNVTHTGTNPSASEWMRLYDSVGPANQTYQYTTASSCRDIENVKCQYILSLQNDFLALWVGVDPATATYGNNGGAGDLVVVTNVTALRPTDVSCTAFISSCCYGSGRFVSAGNVGLTLIANPMGLVQMLRSLAGAVWQSGYMPVPKSMPYFYDPYRAASDINGAFEFCDMEVIQGSQSGIAPSATDLKRGDIPYLKMPMSLPTAHQQQFSYVKPDSSVELYMLIWLPPLSGEVNYSQNGVSEMDVNLAVNAQNAGRCGGNQGGLYYGSRGAGTVNGFVMAGVMFRPHWILIPIF